MCLNLTYRKIQRVNFRLDRPLRCQKNRQGLVFLSLLQQPPGVTVGRTRRANLNCRGHCCAGFFAVYVIIVWLNNVKDTVIIYVPEVKFLSQKSKAAQILECNYSVKKSRAVY